MNARDQWCFDCKAMHPHERAEGGVVCTGCATHTEAPAELLDLAFAEPVPVQGMERCPWCRTSMPVGHVCPAGAVGCTKRQPDETPCGACDRCYEVQGVDLARRAEFEHGSPSDLYTP